MALRLPRRLVTIYVRRAQLQGAWRVADEAEAEARRLRSALEEIVLKGDRRASDYAFSALRCQTAVSNREAS